MGFLDKAKKYAEQAQEKIDEVQKNFNEGQQAKAGAAPSGPVTEYDKHGRPVGDPAAPPPPAAPPAATAPPVPGGGTDPLLADAPAPPPPPPTPPVAEAPAAPPKPPAPPAGDAGAGDSRRDENGPPTLSSGDPLAG
jgi:hypothetical protein